MRCLSLFWRGCLIGLTALNCCLAAAETAQPAGAPASPGPKLMNESSPKTSGQLIQSVALDSVALWSSDILLSDTMLEYRQTRPRSELELFLSHGYTGLEYQPEPNPGSRVYDVLKDNEVSDQRFGIRARGRYQVLTPLTLNLGGGYYDGYLDYRSLWLNEFYRQLDAGYRKIDLGYRPADPWGWNVVGGARWEYWPKTGFVQGDVAYLYDVIAPGYDLSLHYFPLKLIRRNDQLDTVSGRLTLENVLTPRLRTLQELQIADTTDRELRFAVQSSLNWALAEHWTARLVGGASKEAPQFEAWWVGATVERDWNQTWFLSLFGRFYQDNGQIENSLPSSNTAAPPVDTWQAGLGLRWQGERSSLKLLAGPYFSRYDLSAPAARSFAHLYQSRDWFSVQLAFARQF
jgi:hypothetical protein